jgi:hypothetical protein
MPSSTHSEGQEYQYSPLKPGHIRVLHLGKGNDKDARFDTRLRFTLKHISLDRPQSFDALSYTWGPAVFSEQAILGGTPFWLTPSCDAALRRLRDSFNLRTVWVDAICINQKDDDEKSSQIRLMRDIYGMAKKVYVWLGESSRDGSSDHAISWLQDVSVASYPILGVRVGGLRGIMHPVDMVRLACFVPELIRASKKPSGLCKCSYGKWKLSNLRRSNRRSPTSGLDVAIGAVQSWCLTRCCPARMVPTCVDYTRACHGPRTNHGLRNQSHPME